MKLKSPHLKTYHPLDTKTNLTAKKIETENLTKPCIFKISSSVAGMAWQQPNQWNWGSSWTADGKRYYKRDADGNRVTRGYLNRQEESFKDLKEKLRLAEEKVETKEQEVKTREKQVNSEKSEKEKLLREKLDLQAQLFKERTEKEDLRTRGRTLLLRLQKTNEELRKKIEALERKKDTEGSSSSSSSSTSKARVN